MTTQTAQGDPRFPYLGFGLRLRREYVPEVLSRRPDVGWFEIISENYMDVEPEPLGHHADYHPLLAIRPHGPAEDVFSTAEPALPDVVTDQHHRIGSGCILSLGKAPSDDRGDSQRFEQPTDVNRPV